MFSAWCAQADRTHLPASPETVLDYVAARVQSGRNRLATIHNQVFAVQHWHRDAGYPSPVTPEVRELMRNARRKLKERPQGKRALTPDHLRRICELLLARGSNVAKRDHAMILFAFACGWRRSEVVSLLLGDLRFDDEHMIVELGASKTDQDAARGRIVSIPAGKYELTCPTSAMRAWLSVRGNWRGPLFCCCDTGDAIVRRGLAGTVFNKRLKRLLEEIGENAAPYGAHSLRTGMVTTSAENGADVTVIMQRTGHRSVQTIMRYVRPATVFRADPLAGVL